MQRLLRYITWLFAGVSAAAPVAGAGGAPPPYARAFDLAFVPRWKAQVGEETVSFRVFEAGQLRLPSGKIVACDPFVNMDRPAFTVSVPAGEYSVRLALVEGGNDARRVAFARLAISSAPVVRWEMALVAGQDATTLKADEIFGYPVDAGTGSFLDAETGAAAWPKMTEDEDIAQGWITQGDKLSAGPGTPTFHLDVDVGQGNIVMFTSGWGDGFYASWFGYDAQGRVAALVTDFAVVDWAKAKW
jgi:hypothetical protein